MHFKMLSAICFNLDQPKILLSGNGLTIHSSPYGNLGGLLKILLEPAFSPFLTLMFFTLSKIDYML